MWVLLEREYSQQVGGCVIALGEQSERAALCLKLDCSQITAILGTNSIESSGQ